MEEKELIDLINDVEYGEISLNELSKNSIKKARVIQEVRKLYSKINTYKQTFLIFNEEISLLDLGKEREV